MKYKACYGIDCGVSHGFGLKYPDYVERDEILPAENDSGALLKAAELARHFSRDYLSNPENHFTTVTLLEFHGPDGELDQKETLKKAGLNCIKGFEWAGKRLSIRSSSIEHLLLLDAERALAPA